MQTEPQAPFTVHATGSIGQEIHDAGGRTVAWTTDAWVAQVICMLLNENEHLLLRQKEGRSRPMEELGAIGRIMVDL